ncbi:hypothetical protein GCM10023238_11590 [Streptomyces heliomycini]
MAVDDVRDPRVAAVVLVEEKRAVAVLFGRVVRGVHVVGEAVVLQLRSAQSGPGPCLPLLLR